MVLHIERDSSLTRQTRPVSPLADPLQRAVALLVHVLGIGV